MNEIQTLIDNTTTAWYTYVCSSEPWIATSAPLWKIIKVNNSNWSTQFPKVDWVVSDWYINIADNRASLTYSYN